jgi:CheY-like chemotaxis protein
MSTARILVVDDNTVMLDAISRMLRVKGYDVLSAASPRQALEIVRDSPPIHLVVADFLMPDMQGTQLVREVLRLSPQTAGVLMTGYVPSALDVPDGVALLTKPFTSEKLFRAIQAALARPD